MKTLLISSIVAVTLLSGCKTIPTNPAVVTVEVPIPVPCRIKAPEVPSWPLQTAPVSKGNIFNNTQLALAEIELRKGYEARLESAIKECNDKK